MLEIAIQWQKATTFYSLLSARSCSAGPLLPKPGHNLLKAENRVAPIAQDWFLIKPGLAGSPIKPWLPACLPIFARALPRFVALAPGKSDQATDEVRLGVYT